MRTLPSSVGCRPSTPIAAALGAAIALAATSTPATALSNEPQLAHSRETALSPLVVVEGSGSAIAELRGLAGSRIIAPVGPGRWVARLAKEQTAADLAPGLTQTPLPASRLVDPAVRSILEAGLAGAEGPARPFWVIPTDRNRPARRRVAARALALGGSAGLVESDALLMTAELTPRGLADLVTAGEILWAEPRGAYETDGGDETSFVRDFGGANAVEAVGGFTGAGVIVEVVDKGLWQDHTDLLASDPFLRTLNDGPTDHGTATYGIVFGDGETESSARGMMPGRHGLFSSYLDIADRDAHMAELANDFGGVIQSNSWGSPVNRRYTAPSAAMDDSILRHGVLVFQSQSNRGSPDSRPEAWAKNAISVGGVRGYGTLDRSDDSWGFDASTGPAFDGRIKPDLVLFNDGIMTTSDAGDGTHFAFTGTSAATPAVAGHAGIMIEMWRAGVFHGGHASEVPTQTPSVAMSRAILINTARPYAFGHVAEDLGRFRQGWGTPDLLNMWASAPGTAVFDETQPLAEGDAWVRTFEVAAGEPRLGVTLAWTDPPALPFADLTTINNLDLRVIAPDGTVYLGNEGLHDGPNSTPRESRDPAPDPVNTVENVFIDQPQAGIWQVEVTAPRVAVDTTGASGAPRTPFALIATGVDPEPNAQTVRVVGEVPDRFPVRDQMTIEFETAGFTPRGDGEMRFRWNNTVGAFPLEQIAPDRFRAVVSGFECGVDYAWSVSIPTQDGRAVKFPPDTDAARPTVVGANPVRTEPNQSVGWYSSTSPGLTSGKWERGTPAGGGLRWDPPFDADGDGECWMTDNRAGSSGVEGGSATLMSIPLPFSPIDNAAIAYDLWLASDSAGLSTEDAMLVEVSSDFGLTWSTLAVERSSFRWQRRVHPVDLPATGVLRVRFTVTNGGDGSYVEAGIDGLAVVGDTCPACRGDVDGDGVLDLRDLSDFVSGYFNQNQTADLDDNGVIDLLDIMLFLTDFQSRCGG